MENETINLAGREIYEMRSHSSLSIEELLGLAEQVDNWKATCVYRHQKKQHSHSEPSVTKFQGVVGNITLDLESSSACSFSRCYIITAHTPLNILGDYKEKESKCVPRLVQLYTSLETRYVQDYLERVKTDMREGFEEARKLLRED